MADVDSARAALVTQPYRYAIHADSSIKAKHTNAADIEIDTNLDATGGAAFADMVWAASSIYARTFQCDVEDVQYLEDWTTGANRYFCTFSEHPAAASGSAYTQIGATINFKANTTTLTVRG